MKLVQYIFDHWEDEDFWITFADYAAVYGIYGMFAFAAGLIIAALIIL